MLMIGKELSAEQRLDKAVIDIMANPRYVALAGVIMIGSRCICDETPTACTNGRDEKYGRAFVESISDAQLRFLVLHENYHKLYRHLTTWKHLHEQDHDRANRACDYVINQKIMDDNPDGFVAFIQGGCLDDKYRGWDTARVFNDLPPCDNDDELDEHDWDGAQELSEQEQQDLARDIDEAIRQGAYGAGKMGADVDRSLQELMQPQVDWREVLRDFVTDTCAGADFSTWSKPSRRYIGVNMYMPSGVSEQVGELVIAVDTSGSIRDRDLAMFLSEVKGICETVNPERIRLLYWGHEVVGDETYETDELENLTQSTNPRGGGGTDVNCVTDYIAEKSINAQACIVLTDGVLYSGWGEWSMPVLWTILDNKHATPSNGKYVHINTNA